METNQQELTKQDAATHQCMAVEDLYCRFSSHEEIEIQHLFHNCSAIRPLLNCISHLEERRGFRNDGDVIEDPGQYETEELEIVYKYGPCIYTVEMVESKN